MEKRFDVATVLDVCMDLLADLGNVTPEFGQKEQLIEDFHITLGGSAGIFASQCAKLGLRTAGTGIAGNDHLGRMFYEELEKSGVCMEKVRLDGAYKTGVGIALNKRNGDRSILTYMGTIGAVDYEGFREIIKNTRHLHIASYYLLKDMQDIYREILPALKRDGVTVSLDTNWDPMEEWKGGLNEILPFVDILLANEQEMLAVSGKGTLKEAAGSLQRQVPVVVLKKGRLGAEAYKSGQRYVFMEQVRVPVDTVGAGDSFDAGFIYGFLRGCSLEESLKIGCFCGGRSVTRAGGVDGQPSLKELKCFYKTKERR